MMQRKNHVNWGKTALRFCLALSFLTVANGIYAQDDLDLSSLSLEDLLNVEVTVASKSEETVADAPSSVTVFTRAEIQNMGITYFEELLDYVPGFQSQQQTSYGQANTVQARGKPGGGFLSKEVLVLIDGVRLNDAFTGGSSMINRYTTIDNIKQVEIIRGPGSALYGSNAFLGVINIITVDSVNEATARFGSNENRDISANFFVESGDLKISGFARSKQDDGQSYFLASDFVGASGFTEDPRETQDVTIRFQYKSFQFSAGFMEQDLPDHMGALSANGQEVSRNEQKQERYAVRWDHSFNDKLDMTLSASTVEAEEFMLWSWPEITLDFGLFLDVFNDSYNADFSYQLSENNSLSFGGSYEERGVNDNAIIGRNANGAIEFFTGDAGTTENATQDVTAFYIQDQHQFGESLKLILGVRYDDYSDFGDTTNPRGALIYTSDFNAKFKLMYGQAFLAPTNSEQFQKNTLASSGNPTLGPEEIETWELAWNQNVNNRLNFTLTYYSSTINDLIVLVPAPDIGPTATTPINQGEIDLEGIEFEFNASLAEGLLLRGAFTSHTDHEDAWSAEQYGSIILNYRYQNKLNFNINANYRDDIPQVTQQSSYWVANSSIRYYLFDDFDVQLSAKNLFDEEYFSPDAPFTNVGIEVEGRGREVNIGGNYRF